MVAAVLLPLMLGGCVGVGERMLMGRPGHIIDIDSYEVTPEIKPGLGPLTKPDKANQTFRFKMKGIDFLQASEKYNMEARFRIRWRIDNKMTTAMWYAVGMLVILDDEGKERIHLMWYNDDLLVPSGCRQGETFLTYNKFNEDHVWLASRQKGASFKWQWYELGVGYNLGLATLPAFEWNETKDDVIHREGKADVLLKEDSRNHTLIFNERYMTGFLCDQWYQFYKGALRSVVVKLRNDEYTSKKHQAYDFIALRNNLSRLFGDKGEEVITWREFRPLKKMSGIGAVLRKRADKVCFNWENTATKAGLCLMPLKKGKMEAFLTFTPTVDHPLKIKKKKSKKKKRRKPKKRK